MSTVNFNLYTHSFSTTNIVRVNIYKEVDELAIIASKEQQGPVPNRVWSFPGLEKDNYVCRIIEVAAGVEIREYAKVYFVPGGENTVKYHDPFVIQPGTTAGAEAGAYSAVFDGSNGTEDLRGWDISQLTYGSGFIDRGLAWSWDIVTGTLSLGVEFGPLDGDGTYTIQFKTIVAAGGGSINTAGDIWKTTTIVTGEYDINAVDFGTKLLVRGATGFFRLRLPDIRTVVPNRLLFIESARGNHKGFALDTAAIDGGKIDWLGGNRSTIYFNPQESMAIYRLRIDEDNSEWRVHDGWNGSWFRLGQNFYSDASPDMIFNALRLDGGGVTGRGAGLLVDDYPKFYYDFIEKLAPEQLVPYNAWVNGDNKYKYSLAGGDPLRFHIPDRRDKFNRASADTRLPGSYQQNAMQDHRHIESIGNIPGNGNGETPGTAPNTGKYQGTQTSKRDLTSAPVLSDGSTAASVANETRPDNVAVNEYVYC